MAEEGHRILDDIVERQQHLLGRPPGRHGADTVDDLGRSDAEMVLQAAGAAHFQSLVRSRRDNI